MGTLEGGHAFGQWQLEQIMALHVLLEKSDPEKAVVQRTKRE